METRDNPRNYETNKLISYVILLLSYDHIMENSEKSYPKRFLHHFLSSFLANDVCWLQCYGRRLHTYLDLLSLIREKKIKIFVFKQSDVMK